MFLSESAYLFNESLNRAIASIMRELGERGFSPTADMTEPITATVYMTPKVRVKVTFQVDPDPEIAAEFKGAAPLV
jgi:hypothetical protein